MKKLLVIIFVLPFVFTMCKNDDVPDAVKAKFKEMYPNVTDVKWEQEKDKTYEGKFKDDGKDWEISFKADGTWDETERNAEEAEIPAMAKEYWRVFYGELKADVKFEKNSDGEFYEFEAEKDTVCLAEAFFDLKGNIAKDEKNVCVKKFKELYVAATDVKWEKEEGQIEAEFKMNDVKASVKFDDKGNVLEVESEIKETDLPKAITDDIAKNFKGAKIKEAAKSEANGAVSYEAEIEQGGKVMELLYDSNGKLTKKKEKDKEDKEDKD
ncbi:MAG: PepSY-like domain-containing protein [Bacteroidia bacterium]|nr:PepSY-like domain-containing protein [Bacteroidia bacterium]